jgi:hypothetical protein
MSGAGKFEDLCVDLRSTARWRLDDEEDPEHVVAGVVAAGDRLQRSGDGWPRVPEKLPTELIGATPTTAAVPVRYRDGSCQNLGMAEKFTAEVMENSP